MPHDGWKKGIALRQVHVSKPDHLELSFKPWGKSSLVVSLKAIRDTFFFDPSLRAEQELGQPPRMHLIESLVKGANSKVECAEIIFRRLLALQDHLSKICHRNLPCGSCQADQKDPLDSCIWEDWRGSERVLKS